MNGSRKPRLSWKPMEPTHDRYFNHRTCRTAELRNAAAWRARDIARRAFDIPGRSLSIWVAATAGHRDIQPDDPRHRDRDRIPESRGYASLGAAGRDVRRPSAASHRNHPARVAANRGPGD